MKHQLILLTVLLAILLSAAEVVRACSCAGGANPCGFFRRDKGVAFIGTVTSVVDSNEKYGRPVKGRVRKITIKVDEIFKGTLPDEVVTSDDGFQCDNYPFSLGGKYLIYAGGILENTENILPVQLCGGTAPVESAGESIKFLRQLKSGVMPSILYGKVQRVVNGSGDPHQPLASTKVVLTKTSSREGDQYKKPAKRERRLVTLTDEKGEYKFENLGTGLYKISVDLPGDLWMQEYREFAAGGSPYCDAHYLYAYTNGSISGNVTNADGTPARMTLMLQPVDGRVRFFYNQTHTDENGNFTFPGLNEGQYRIYTSLTTYSLDGARTYLFSSDYPFREFYFPNAVKASGARIVSLGHAQKIYGLDLKMPPPPIKRNISGLLVWPDGRPVDKGTVSYRVKDKPAGTLRHALVKGDGSFSFQIYEGFDYEVFANNNSSSRYGYLDWTPLDKNVSDGSLKLILKPKE